MFPFPDIEQCLLSSTPSPLHNKLAHQGTTAIRQRKKNEKLKKESIRSPLKRINNKRNIYPTSTSAEKKEENAGAHHYYVDTADRARETMAEREREQKKKEKSVQRHHFRLFLLLFFQCA